MEGLKMKITKSVDERGNINVEFADVPALPEPVEKRLRDIASNVTKIGFGGVKLGDFSVSFRHNYNPERENNLPNMPEWSYHVLDPAEKIAKTIQNRINTIWDEWNRFITQHTESVDVQPRDNLLQKLDSECRLLYRGKDGKFHKFE
jgi:hypothetical protein